MTQGNISIPSELNQYDFVTDAGLQLNTSNAPFEFFTSDGCGNKEVYDLVTNAIEFEVKIEFNDCIIYELVTGEIKIEANKMYLETTSLNLKRGVYDYTVFFKDVASVIKGKLTAK
jgi:hypothetical protein